MKLILLFTSFSAVVICNPYSDYQGTRSQKSYSCDLSKVNEIKRTEKLPINVIKRLNEIGCYDEAEAYEDDIPSYLRNSRSGLKNFGNSNFDKTNKFGADPSYYHNFGEIYSHWRDLV